MLAGPDARLDDNAKVGGVLNLDGGFHASNVAPPPSLPLAGGGTKPFLVE